METLHPVLEERDRLRVELRALDAEPEPLAVPESPVVRGPSLDPGRFAVPREEPRRPAVSPKVARLMLAPRRPSLERAGVRRVGVGTRAARKGSVEETDALIDQDVASAA
jgi:hypothetical protein